MNAGEVLHPLVAQLRDARNRPALVGFWRAIRIPFQAIGLLRRHRPLWPLVVAPAVINVLLFIAGAVLVITQADAVAGMIWAQPAADGLLNAVRLAVWYLFYAGVMGLGLVVTYVTTLLLGGVLASPFNDVLSARVEREALAGEMPEPDYGLIWGSLRAVGSSIVILLSYGVVMLPILLLNLVPVVGQVAASVLSTGVSAMFIALEFTDYSLERRGLNLRQKFELLEDNRTFALGFGLGTAALIWVPFLNFLTIPIAVAGGTLLGIILTEPTPSIATDTPT